MRKKMIATVTLLVMLLAMLLTGCKKTAVCDFCGEKGKCETRTVFGEELDICVDCLEEIEAFNK